MVVVAGEVAGVDSAVGDERGDVDALLLRRPDLRDLAGVDDDVPALLELVAGHDLLGLDFAVLRTGLPVLDAAVAHGVEPFDRDGVTDASTGGVERDGYGDEAEAEEAPPDRTGGHNEPSGRLSAPADSIRGRL